MSTPQDLSNPAALALASANTRPRFTFTIPKRVRQIHDPEKVTMQELSVANNLQAAQSAQGDDERRALEMLKHCVVEVDGQPLGWANGAKEDFIERISSKVRTLLLKAMVRINTPQRDEEDAFFASQETSAS